MDSYSYVYMWLPLIVLVDCMFVFLKSISISALDDGVGAAGTEASAPLTTLMIRVK